MDALCLYGEKMNERARYAFDQLWEGGFASAWMGELRRALQLDLPYTVHVSPIFQGDLWEQRLLLVSWCDMMMLESSMSDLALMTTE